LLISTNAMAGSWVYGGLGVGIDVRQQK